MARKPKPISAAQLAIAAQRSKAGVSMRVIAADLGIDRRTLERRLKTEGASLGAARRDDAPPDDADDLDEQAAKAAARMGLAGTDPEAQRARLQATIESEQRIVDELTAAGEYAEVRKHRQVLIQAENVLRAINKSEDPDEIKVTKAQLQEAEKEALATLARYAEARPQCCARCSRKLSLAWSEGRDA